MKKDILVKTKPMIAVLNRYGIGKRDRYDRGLWISVADLPDIIDGMIEDKTALEAGNDTYVMGTNRHNYVCTKEFYELFD